MQQRPIRLLVFIPCAAILPAQDGAATDFASDLRPLLARYCFDCHDAERPKGDVVLAETRSRAQVFDKHRLWQRVVEVLESGQMPPAKRRRQPQPAERKALVQGIRELLATGRAIADPGRPTLRRLTRDHFERSVSELLGIPFRAAGQFPKDPQGHGFDSLGDTLFSSPLLVEKYLDASQQAMDALRRAPRARAVLIPSPPVHDRAGQRHFATRRLRGFLRRAFRRPPRPAEVRSRMAIYQRAREAGHGYPEAVLQAMQSVLLAPQFLFRVEVDRQQPAAWPLGGHELATRLSYFLWATLPDTQLEARADAGDLQDEDVLRAEVRRMLDDPRARSLTEVFAAQWLGFGEISTHAADVRRFRGFNQGVKDDLYTETALFFDALRRQDLPLTLLLDSDHSYLNNALAHHYGVKNVRGRRFRRVRLPDRRRGGILGMGSILTTTSYPLRTSPVLRGVWILERLLDAPPPPPPPNAGTLPPDDKQKDSLTLRQRLEQHRARASCAACHARIDPLGFALEAYDGIGRWRSENHGQKVDTLATMPDGTVLDGPVALKDWLLAHKPAFLRSSARRLLIYALGRDTNLADERALDQIVAATRQRGDRWRAMLEAVVLSYPFRHNRSAR